MKLPAKHFLLPLFTLFLLHDLPGQGNWTCRFNSAHEVISTHVFPDHYGVICKDSVQIFFIRVSSDGVPTDTVLLGPKTTEIIVAQDGSFFKGHTIDSLIIVRKLDEHGALLWENQYIDSLDQESIRLATLPDGGCYVSTVAIFNHHFDFHVYCHVGKLDASGNYEWTAKFDREVISRYTLIPKYISDAVVLPDQSLLMLVQNPNNYQYSYEKCYGLVIQENGNFKYTLGPFNNEFQTTADFRHLKGVSLGNDGKMSVLLNVNSYSSPSGGFSYNMDWIQKFDWQTGNDTGEKTEFPYSNYSNWNHFPPVVGVDAHAIAAMANGDLAVFQKSAAGVELVRGLPDLSNTTWKIPFNVQVPANNYKGRILKKTDNDGLLLGWQDSLGVFLTYTGFWGPIDPGAVTEIKVALSEDTDKQCSTAGPYAPAVGQKVRLYSDDFPGINLLLTIGPDGTSSTLLPAAHWKAVLKDSIPWYAGSVCGSGDPLVFDMPQSGGSTITLSPIALYTGKISGSLRGDFNNDCQPDGTLNGQAYKTVQALHDGKTFLIPLNPDHTFSVSVDTGWYHLSVPGLETSITQGQYCPLGQDVYVPDYQSVAPTQIVYSRLENSFIELSMLRDIDGDCLNAGEVEPIPGSKVVVEDLTTNEIMEFTTSFPSNVTVPVLKASILEIRPEDGYQDYPCDPNLPLIFEISHPDQHFSGSIRVVKPQVNETVFICQGDSFHQFIPLSDTILMGESLYKGVPADYTWTVHINPVHSRHEYAVDTGLSEDSVEVIRLTNQYGCDSTIYIHILSSNPSLEFAPNPATDQVSAWLNFPTTELAQVMVFDAWGTLIQSEYDVADARLNLNITALSPGVYTVHVTDTQGRIAVGQFIKV